MIPSLKKLYFQQQVVYSVLDHSTNHDCFSSLMSEIIKKESEFKSVVIIINFRGSKPMDKMDSLLKVASFYRNQCCVIWQVKPPTTIDNLAVNIYHKEF